jgi:hypothetical protein
MFGFELAESMTGSWHSFDAPLDDRPVRMKLRLTVDGLRKFALERSIKVEGTIWADGLATERSVSGDIKWRLLDENRVPYRLEFDGDDGRLYRIQGQRDFFVYNAIESLTTMYASLYHEDGHEMGRTTLHFEPKVELPALIRTFRPKLFLK